jgi:hypothetical protein
VYNPATDQWNQSFDPADLPWRVISPVWARSMANCMLLVALSVGGMFTTKTAIYDPQTNSWNDAAMADLPNSTVFLSGGGDFVTEGQLFCAGALIYNNGTLTITDDVWAYDPITNSWVQSAELAEKRVRGEADTWEDMAFLIGGGEVDGLQPIPTNTLQYFNSGSSPLPNDQTPTHESILQNRAMGARPGLLTSG